MKDFLKKRSKTEVTLLLILIIIAGYYLLVQLPLSKLQPPVDAELAQVENDLAEANDKLTQLPAITAKVQDYKKTNAPKTQDYDNANSIIMDLNGIFGGADNYEITFQDKVWTDKIVRKSVTLQFSAASYSSAVTKIKALETSKNAYLLNATAIVDGSDSTDQAEGVTVTVEMTVFEYDANAQPAPAEDEAAAETETAE